MQRNGVIKFDYKFLKQYLPFITFTTLFVLGIIIGSLSIGSSDYLIATFQEQLNNYIDVRKNDGFLNIVKNSFIFSFPFYVIVFLCGTSLIGCALTPLAILFKGFTYGCLSSCLYSAYKLNGIVFNALILIPPTAVSVFGLILISMRSFAFSYLLSGICIKANRPINIYSYFKTYCLYSLIFLVISLLSILFDVGLSAIFIDFFDF